MTERVQHERLTSVRKMSEENMKVKYSGNLSFLRRNRSWFQFLHRSKGTKFEICSHRSDHEVSWVGAVLLHA